MTILGVLFACEAPPPGARTADPWTDPASPVLADRDPDPDVFEADLAARPTRWEYAPGAFVDGLGYEGAVPGPLIRVAQDTRLLLHFDNQLPADFPTTIHWHGIEGNNAADGTHVTQAHVMPGESFDYDMVVPRAGLYWYHPHARGAQGVFDGLYAPLVVEDPDEAELIERGILPADERILVLSDVTEMGQTPISVEVDNAMEVMNGTEGAHLLVNGREDPVFRVTAGGAVRLRVVNTSITRFWRLSVPGRSLFRVGGEGGLLDRVRVEGGSVEGRATSLDDGRDLGPAWVPLGYDRGQIVLGPAERADLVLVTYGEPGTTLELRWEDVARGRHGMWMEDGVMVMEDAPDDGLREGRTAATFELVEGDAVPWTLREGDPILEAVGRRVGQVDVSSARAWTSDAAMVFSENMDMFEDEDGVWQMTTELLLDGRSWKPDHHGGPTQPEAPTAVHARVGDAIVWEVRNDSAMSHPMHLHGFSYQPVRYVHTDEEAGRRISWDVGYDEFEDTTIVPGHTSVFLHLKLDDPVGNGGAVGRWMRHCHILQHGENGMMSELVVAP